MGSSGEVADADSEKPREPIAASATVGFEGDLGNADAASFDRLTSATSATTGSASSTTDGAATSQALRPSLKWLLIWKAGLATGLAAIAVIVVTQWLRSGEDDRSVWQRVLEARKANVTQP
jgi:hypothetical protein